MIFRSSGAYRALLLCMSDAVSVPTRRPTADTPSSNADVEAYYREIAPFYDAELSDRDDLAFWSRLASESPGSRILELGAGSGAVTAQVAPVARQLVGIDISNELLRLARRRVAPWSHVTLLRADMRALPLRGQFDLIVAANDPLSHLTEDSDRDEALRAAAGLLAPDGRFVLDALWLPPADARAVASPAGRVQEHDETLKGQPLHVVERWRRDPAHRACCRARYEYHRPGHQTVVASFEARDWEPDELSDRLNRAGLTVTERWGSYRRESWDPHTSRQLIVAAGHAS